MSRTEQLKLALEILCIPTFFDSGISFETLENILKGYHNTSDLPLIGRSLKLLLARFVKLGLASKAGDLYFFVDTQEETTQEETTQEDTQGARDTKAILNLDNDYINPIKDRLCLYNVNLLLESFEDKIFIFDGNIESTLLNEVIRPIVKIALSGEIFNFEESEVVCNIIQERLSHYGYSLESHIIKNEIWYVSDYNYLMLNGMVNAETYVNFNQ
tara:strand:+ start:108 stop:752 length:645 start_codon:yes stop_codon:yes gene_type:complete